MDNLNWREFLPVIAIAGPVLASLITLWASRHFREKKQLTFVILRSENLVQPLRRYRHRVTLRIDDTDVADVSRGLVWVENNGNKEIRGARFEIVIPGIRQMRLAEIRADDEQIRNAVETEWQRRGNDDVAIVSIPFLNPGESFRVLIVFDGPTVDCEVSCRIEGVRARIQRDNAASAFAPEAVEALLGAYERIPILGPLIVQLARAQLQQRNKRRAAQLEK